MITVGTANKVAKALGLSLSQFFQQLDHDETCNEHR